MVGIALGQGEFDDFDGVSFAVLISYLQFEQNFCSWKLR